MVTQRAWLTGAIGFCFYLVTIVNSLPFYYYILTWLAAGILGSSLAVAILSLTGLRCNWRVPPAIVTENFTENAGGPTIEIEFANEGTLNKTNIQIEVILQRSNDAALVSRRFLLEALPSGNKISSVLPIRSLRRGRYKVTQIRLIGSDVLGLFLIRKSASPSAEKEVSPSSSNNEIVVGPAALSGSSASMLPQQAAAGGDIPAMHRQGQDRDIRGTRFYAPGDDLRHVHWKTTARKGQLVVKEFHHAQQEQTLVVWDGALPTLSPKPLPGRLRRKARQKQQEKRQQKETEVQEWSLRLTATICRTLIEGRRPLALLRLDEAPLALGLDGASYGRNLNITQVSSALADARPTRTVSLARALEPFRARWSSGWPSGRICLIATSLAPFSPELVAHLCLGGAEVVIGLIAVELTTPEQKQEVLSLQKAGAYVVGVELSKDPQLFNRPITIAAKEMLEPITARQPSLLQQTVK